jgi:hypothetical protein
MNGFETPVLILAHSRPDLTELVMEAVARARPARLFLACDGPRGDVAGERERVAEVRRVMDAAITWPSEVYRLHQDRNLGCRRAIQAGIDWFFAHVDEGIILEDDCIPHPDFFAYCQELLTRYRDDARVMHISGDGSMRSPRSRRPTSYVFTHHAAIFGWATWRRAWQRYDRDLAGWREMRDDPVRVAALFPHEVQRAWWTRILEGLERSDDAHTWDFQWMFTVRNAGGLAVVPTSNLITNLGFRSDGTHVTVPDHRAAVPLEAMPTIVHPDEVAVDPGLDWQVQCDVKGWGRRPSLRARVFSRARSVLGRAARSLGLRRTTDVPDA